MDQLREMQTEGDEVGRHWMKCKNRHTETVGDSLKKLTHKHGKDMRKQRAAHSTWYL
jgi:hypothetical protein